MANNLPENTNDIKFIEDSKGKLEAELQQIEEGGILPDAGLVLQAERRIKENMEKEETRLLDAVHSKARREEKAMDGELMQEKIDNIQEEIERLSRNERKLEDVEVKNPEALKHHRIEQESSEATA